MNYQYKCLVVDDEPQVSELCEGYKEYLQEQGVDIEFDIIVDETEYNPQKPYDILLVDYDLKRGNFPSSKQMGDEFIRKFRENNRVSKVIFYSSGFEYKPIDKKFKLDIADKEIFELINDMQVDRVADKNNFDMMLQVIKSCCVHVDILHVVLSKMLREYKGEDISVTYTTIDNEDIDVESLLSDLMVDNQQGRRFRQQVLDSVVSILFNFKY